VSGVRDEAPMTEDEAPADGGAPGDERREAADGDGGHGADPAAALTDHGRQVRLVEALLFAAPEPMDAAALRARLPAEADLAAILADLEALYAGRGIVLARVAGGWAFRTAADLAPALKLDIPTPKKLTRAALETLAIVAYHQPATRGEIESIRGVATSKGTLDTLMEAGWIRPGRRRQSPGRPLTWVTTKGFLDHFGLDSLDELPGIEELKAAGLLDARPAIATLPGGRADARDEDALPPVGDEDALSPVGDEDESEDESDDEGNDEGNDDGRDDDADR